MNEWPSPFRGFERQKLVQMNAAGSPSIGFPFHGMESLLSKELGVINASCRIQVHAPHKEQSPYSKIKNIFTVGAGKGGVGKSTVAMNLALSFRRMGAKVGLLDADLYGPNIHHLMGLDGRCTVRDQGWIPMRAQGVEVMSIRFVMNESALVWRGPMLSKGLMQLVHQTHWGDLDYLIIDLPPGTGDVALTLAQKVPLVGALMVQTPHALAKADTQKAIEMFQVLGVPILGTVENMSFYRCTACGQKDEVFGSGEENVLWKLPFTPEIDQPEQSLQYGLDAMALAVGARISLQPLYTKGMMPRVVVENT